MTNRIQELRRRANESGAFVHPDVDRTVPEFDLLSTVGLPSAIADWFVATTKIHRGVAEVDDRFWILGDSPQGPVALDGDSGAVVLLDEYSESAVFVNSSLFAFLQCSVLWIEAVTNGFEDFDDRPLIEADAQALSDENGVWSSMAEEALEGLY